MSVTIITTGLLTSLQDAGRQADAGAAIPVSGAMDQYALQAANLLVGNWINSAVLEATYTGPVLEFNRDALVAVTGARTVPLVDAVEQSLYTAFEIKAGQRLSFAYAKGGARIYIAVAGGFNLPLVRNSRSSLDRLNLSQLQPGDRLPIGQELAAKVYPYQTLPPKFQLNTIASNIGIDSRCAAVKMTAAQQQRLFNTDWVIDARSNRIGCYFKAEPNNFSASFTAASSAILPEDIRPANYPAPPLGLLQWINQTELALWQRDAINYDPSKILGAVTQVDLNLLAQLAPGHLLRFTSLTPAQVQQQQRYYQDKIQQLRQYYQEFLYISGPSQAELLQQWQELVEQQPATAAIVATQSAAPATPPTSTAVATKAVAPSEPATPSTATAEQNLIAEVICLPAAAQYATVNLAANVQLDHLAAKLVNLEQTNQRLDQLEMAQLEEISELKQMLLYSQGYSIKTDAQLAATAETLVSMQAKLQHSELELTKVKQCLLQLEQRILANTAALKPTLAPLEPAPLIQPATETD